MNKFCFCILVLLLYVNNFAYCGHVYIPKQDIELAKGFLDGSGVKTFLNLDRCEREFYDFVQQILDVFDSLSKNDNKAEILKDLGSSFILYSDLMNRCEGTKEKLDLMMNFLREAFNNPQKYLVGVMDNAVSFHVIKLYWGLSGKVKEGKFYEVGSIIGEMIKYIVDVNIERSELRFLSQISGEKEIKNMQTGCKEVLYELINEIFTVNNNILNGSAVDVSLVGKNFNRIFEYILKLRSC